MTDESKLDTERLDYLEAIIRDGSYVSIFNDIVAICQHAYVTFGSGPALRTAIDGCRQHGVSPQDEAILKAVLGRIGL